MSHASSRGWSQIKLNFILYTENTWYFTININIKAKAVSLHAMEAIGGEEIYLLLIPDFGTGLG
jgi:protein involved in ribonucleotide reduction